MVDAYLLSIRWECPRTALRTPNPPQSLINIEALGQDLGEGEKRGQGEGVEGRTGDSEV